MPKIEVFEAAGCCAVSNVVVSDEAIEWDASTEWAKKNGVNIQRYSLTKSLQRFLNTSVIEKFLNILGMELFSVTLLDGKLMMVGKLPTHGDITRQAGIPLTQDWSGDNAQPRCYSIPRMP